MVPLEPGGQREPLATSWLCWLLCCSNVFCLWPRGFVSSASIHGTVAAYLLSFQNWVKSQMHPSSSVQVVPRSKIHHWICHSWQHRGPWMMEKWPHQGRPACTLRKMIFSYKFVIKFQEKQCSNAVTLSLCVFKYLLLCLYKSHQHARVLNTNMLGTLKGCSSECSSNSCFFLHSQGSRGKVFHGMG